MVLLHATIIISGVLTNEVVTFERNGVRSYGFLENDRVLDVGNRLASRYGDLRRVLAAGALRELQIASTQGAQTFQVEEVNFEPESQIRRRFYVSA